MNQKEQELLSEIERLKERIARLEAAGDEVLHRYKEAAGVQGSGNSDRFWQEDPARIEWQAARSEGKGT